MEIDGIKNQLKLCKKAYATLEEALSCNDLSELEKDGAIQRFEYTIELFGKTGRKYLEYVGVSGSLSPREVFQQLYKYEIINDLEVYFKFIHIRNAMSHMYSEYLSQENFQYISENYELIGKGIDRITKKL